MRLFIGVLLAAIFLGPLPGFAEEAAARGEYLTRRASMCVECHTPRDAKGNLLESKLFHGAPVPVLQPEFATAWALRAPNLTGWPGYTHEQAVHFLQTGERPNGTHARPPMPQYRLNSEDAEAVVAYLQGLH
ncbi:MAG TPA: c-type cytochrome [Verrucomicrobiae bacterium]|nr:c-type cytochrome [Verrucomicrobiae bacterium]